MREQTSCVYNIYKHYDKILLFFALLFCYYTTITTHYYFYDDIFEIFTEPFNPFINNAPVWWLSFGRPIKYIIMSLVAIYINSANYSYTILKFVMFLILYIFALIFLFIIKEITNSTILSLTITIILLTLPTFAIYPVWTDISINIIGFCISSLAFYVPYNHFVIKQNKLKSYKSILIILLAISLNVLAEMDFQIATVIPAVFLFIHIIFDKQYNNDYIENNNLTILQFGLLSTKKNYFAIIIFSIIVITQIVYITSLHILLNIYHLFNKLPNVHQSDILSYNRFSGWQHYFTEYWNANFLFAWFQLSDSGINLLGFIILILAMFLIFKQIMQALTLQDKINVAFKWGTILGCIIITSVFAVREVALRTSFTSSWVWFILLCYCIYDIFNIKLFISRISQKNNISILRVNNYILFCLAIIFMTSGQINTNKFTYNQSLATYSIRLALQTQLKYKNTKNILLVLYKPHTTSQCSIEYQFPIPWANFQDVYYQRLIETIIHYEIKFTKEEYSYQYMKENEYKNKINEIDEKNNIIIIPSDYLKTLGLFRDKCWG